MAEATVRAAELAAEAGVLGGAALPGAAKESGAADPKLGAAVAPDAGGAEDCGVLESPNENPTNTIELLTLSVPTLPTHRRHHGLSESCKACYPGAGCGSAQCCGGHTQSERACGLRCRDKCRAGSWCRGRSQAKG